MMVMPMLPSATPAAGTASHRQGGRCDRDDGLPGPGDRSSYEPRLAREFRPPSRHSSHNKALRLPVSVILAQVRRDRSLAPRAHFDVSLMGKILRSIWSM